MAEDRKFKFENGQFVNRVSGEAIPDDEPVMLFRARDHHALAVVMFYHGLAEDEHHRTALNDRIVEFAEFALDHPERMKEPGVTRHIRLNSDDQPNGGATLYGVWAQARDNHAKYSATGSIDGDIHFHGLGLGGEAGEVLEAAVLVAIAAGKVGNRIKKHWRDGGHSEELAKEVADVFAYNIMLADALGMTPQNLLDMVAHKQEVFIAKMKALQSPGAEG